MDGQATAPEVEGLDSLATFLSDTPDEEPQDEEEGTTEPEEGSEDQPDEAEEDSDSEESEDPPTTDRTFKVKVQGDDGEPVEKDVSEKELLDGYMMRADYTRKTQELSLREKELTQQLAGKFEEHRNHYLNEARLARAAVEQFAGLKTDQEMAQLAQSDPAGWVLENQRQQTVRNILGQLGQRIQQEEHQVHEQRNAQLQQAYQMAWGELSKDGIDKAKLASIYDQACKQYGFRMDDFSNVYDPRAVRVLKDNAEMRERLNKLESKAKTVMKQAKEAPAIPSKQALAQSERKARTMENKFRSGNAKLADLAAFLR